jgi:N-acetylglucosaminyldiphosphoundecaprenol N-acetyl-beta-D-mannosaminyltransferase
VRPTGEPRNSIATRPILGVNVAASSYDQVVQNSLLWARQGLSRAQIFANVQVVMEAVDHPAYLEALNRADMVNPDGMPLVWALRALGLRRAQRVCGSDAMAAILAAADKTGTPIGFYGSSQAVLDALLAATRLQYPHLHVVFAESPPFRALSPQEDAAAVERMNSSGVRLLCVGLGCPKQETWIMEHVGRVHAVLFAFGAAFDFLAGSKPRAPRWMQRSGLEWLFRFVTEPRRLAIRYLKHNPRFVLRFLWQLLAGSA